MMTLNNIPALIFAIGTGYICYNFPRWLFTALEKLALPKDDE